MNSINIINGLIQPHVLSFEGENISIKAISVIPLKINLIHSKCENRFYLYIKLNFNTEDIILKTLYFINSVGNNHKDHCHRGTYYYGNTLLNDHFDQIHTQPYTHKCTSTTVKALI